MHQMKANLHYTWALLCTASQGRWLHSAGRPLSWRPRQHGVTAVTRSLCPGGYWQLHLLPGNGPYTALHSPPPPHQYRPEVFSRCAALNEQCAARTHTQSHCKATELKTSYSLQCPVPPTPQNSLLSSLSSSSQDCGAEAVQTARALMEYLELISPPTWKNTHKQTSVKAPFHPCLLCWKDRHIFGLYLKLCKLPRCLWRQLIWNA